MYSSFLRLTCFLMIRGVRLEEDQGERMTPPPLFFGGGGHSLYIKVLGSRFS